MYVDKHGKAVVVETLVVEDRRTLARTRDLHMIAMSKGGWSSESIAFYFNVTARTVQRRLKAVPTEAKTFYGRSLARMGDALRSP